MSLEEILALHPFDRKRNYRDGESLMRATALALGFQEGKITAIPDSIGLLTNLENLDLSYNNIQTLPEGIGRLPRLRELWITNTGITELPTVITKIRTLQNLKLDITSCKLKRAPIGITELPCWRNNEFLRSIELYKHVPYHMDENLKDVSHLISEWASCLSVYISNNQISELPYTIGTLTQLCSLDVSMNQISCLPLEMQMMNSLTQLVLHQNLLDEFPDVLLLMPWLVSLDLSNNKIESLPEGIRNISLLTRLQLQNNPMSCLPLGITSLRQLNRLVLQDQGKQSIIRGPVGITELPCWKTAVDQYRGSKSKPGMSLIGIQFYQTFNNLGFLDFSRLLDSWKTLRAISCSHNKITGLPDAFSNLIQLHAIDLSYNQLSSISGSFQTLTNLTDLRLSANRFSTLPDVLFGLTSLQTLYIDQNPIEEIPEAISRLQLHDFRLEDRGIVQIRRGPVTVTNMPCWGRNTELYRLEYISTTKSSITEASHFISKHSIATEIRESAANLSLIPQSIGALSQLKLLDVSNNNLFTLPISITQLEELSELRLNGNQFHVLLDWICDLSSLQCLSLYKNPITELPDNITNLRNLRNLEIAEVLEPHKTESFTEKSISESFVQKNPPITIVTAPLWITNLPCWDANEALRRLELRGDFADQSLSDLSHLSKEFFKCLHIDLSKNKLSSLPEFMGRLINLKSLDLTGNQIESLPQWITNLRNLMSLKIAANADSIVRCGPHKLTCLPCWKANKELKALDLYANNSDQELTMLADIEKEWRFARSIIVSNNKLSTLPDSLSTLAFLCSLDISNNQFSEIPHVIERMTRLHDLNIQDNPILELPLWIVGLSHLKNIRVGHKIGKETQLAPLGITSLSCWKDTSADGNVEYRTVISNQNISSLVEYMGQLAQCHHLISSQNEIAALPDNFTIISSIKTLDLSFNQMTFLPDVLFDLSTLECLNISSNQVTAIPEAISKLQSLSVFDFADNKVSILPASLGDIAPLRNSLNFSGNPLIQPPKNVQDRGSSAVFDYLRAALLGGMQLWTQGRILLLGEGEVGKTTLRMSLMQLQEHRRFHSFFRAVFSWTEFLACFNSTVQDLQRTEGVEIETALYVPPHKGNISISTSIWDFGGQDIFHATHVFFLSYGALTIVLYNVAKGPKQSRLGQWLEMVEHTSPDARILIVGTCLDQISKDQQAQRKVQCEIEIQEMKDRFSKIVFSGHIQVSNATGYGLSTLERMIYEESMNLPNIGKEVPRSYIKLKDYLQVMREKSHRMQLSDLVEYCKTSDLHMNASEAESALQFCVDLGVAVWRKQDESVKQTIFLDPKLLIDAFRAIFNISNSKQMNGIFEHKTLEKNLGVGYLAFVQLFRSLGLSYKLSDSLEIFPILVKSQEKSVPASKWNVDSTTKEYLAYMMEFRNEVPKLEISKLIVGLLKSLDEKKIERKSPSVFLGRNNIVLPFSVKSGSIEKGSEFVLRIELISSQNDETQASSSHDVRLPICRHILVHVQTHRSGCSTRVALEVVKKQLIQSKVTLSPEMEGMICPKCRADNQPLVVSGLVAINTLVEGNTTLHCTKGHQIPARDYKRWMLAAGSLTDDFQGNRTKKERLGLQTRETKHMNIFLSSTFLDMKLVRESFTRFAQPIIEMEANGLGLDVTFIDFRWGISQEESSDGLTILKCLTGVKSSDYFVCFLGSRFGWVPNRENEAEWKKVEIESEFPWVKRYSGASATELEIRGACLAKDAQFAYRSFFYERDLKEDFESLSPMDKIDRQNQVKLKEEIQQSFVIHHFREAHELIDMATSHITNALRKDCLEMNQGRTGLRASATRARLLEEREVLDRIDDDLAKHHKTLSEKQRALLLNQIRQGPLKNQFLLQMVMQEIISFGIFEDLKMLLDSLLSPETPDLLMERLLRQWERSYDAIGVHEVLIHLHLASTKLGVSWDGIAARLQIHEDRILLMKSRAFFALLVQFNILDVVLLEGLGHERYRLCFPLLTSTLDKTLLPDRSEKSVAWASYLNLLTHELKNEKNDTIQLPLCLEMIHVLCQIFQHRFEMEDEPSEELQTLMGETVFVECVKTFIEIRQRLESVADQLGFRDSNHMWISMLENSSLAASQLADVLCGMPQLWEAIENSLSKWADEEEKQDDHLRNDDRLYHLYKQRAHLAKTLNRNPKDIQEFESKMEILSRSAFGELNS
eukprot:TRINITY_DN1672_c0_g1_i3.p1 TRINITY_DN1672_c0_g1~~TRINITY_DN1672_c0_g1_i3.p1  ORF type:complete len:2182 (-),score=438.40 TRINITY_DN1672_c0_g1_i3:205-6750(-)